MDGFPIVFGFYAGGMVRRCNHNIFLASVYDVHGIGWFSGCVH